MAFNNICPICLDDLPLESNGNITAVAVVVSAICGHQLCLDCAIRYYIEHHGSACPYCRQTSNNFLVSTTTLSSIIQETNITVARTIHVDSSTREWRLAPMATGEAEIITDRIRQEFCQQPPRSNWHNDENLDDDDEYLDEEYVFWERFWES